ncbi:MAG: mdtA 1 [Planctomycetaceae bacterium]|nr:mdtA 1 [Planctomycetaceae bacterium]
MTDAVTTNVTTERIRPAPAPPGPGSPEDESRRRAGTRILVSGSLVVILLAAALAAGTLPRIAQQKKLDARATQVAARRPRVTVAVVRKLEPAAERILPGNSLPWKEAAMYARSTGFLSQRLVDIGDHVQAGQLLAVIVAPDIDDQLTQARANVEQARATLKLSQANAALARIILARYESIKKENTGAIAQQLLDEQQATVNTTAASVENSQATIDVNQALVRRYADLQSFLRITAPFTGIITARHVEIGDLITADSTARELFHIMQTDTLRVFVNVPQVFATSIEKGQTAAVYRRDEPQNQHPGKVTRTSDALDLNTRTLLTQVEVPNPTNALRPGMQLQVKFIFDRKVSSLMIPTSALATRSTGPRVGVLDAQHRVHYRDVELGRDYGAEVQVLAGLQDGETVVVHPGDDIPEGTVVEPVRPSK